MLLIVVHLSYYRYFRVQTEISNLVRTTPHFWNNLHQVRHSQKNESSNLVLEASMPKC